MGSVFPHQSVLIYSVGRLWSPLTSLRQPFIASRRENRRCQTHKSITSLPGFIEHRNPRQLKEADWGKTTYVVELCTFYLAAFEAFIYLFWFVCVCVYRFLKPWLKVMIILYKTAPALALWMKWFLLTFKVNSVPFVVKKLSAYVREYPVIKR